MFGIPIVSTSDIPFQEDLYKKVLLNLVKNIFKMYVLFSLLEYLLTMRSEQSKSVCHT
jgi:hypothetical protein